MANPAASIQALHGQVDYYGLDDGQFECTSSSASVEVNVIDAPDQNGDIFKSDIAQIGGSIEATYSCKCLPSGGTALVLPELGNIVTPDAGELPPALAGWSFLVDGWTITTAAGAMPTVSLNASGISTTCRGPAYGPLAFTGTIKPRSGAQMLDSCATINGEGVVLSGATYTASGDTVTAPGQTGKVIAADFTAGVVTAALTLQQTEDGKPPAVTAGAGWEITEPLAVSGSAGEWTEWTVTLRKRLKKPATP